MPKIKVELVNEIERLVENAAMRRQMLLATGLRVSRRRRFLTITSGILALFSAGAITSVLTDVFGGRGIQTIAALVAGVSGIISLILGTYSNEDDIAKLFAGASSYLSLRDKVYMLVILDFGGKEVFEKQNHKV